MTLVQDLERSPSLSWALATSSSKPETAFILWTTWLVVNTYGSPLRRSLPWDPQWPVKWQVHAKGPKHATQWRVLGIFVVLVCGPSRSTRTNLWLYPYVVMFIIIWRIIVCNQSKTLYQPHCSLPIQNWLSSLWPCCFGIHQSGPPRVLAQCTSALITLAQAVMDIICWLRTMPFLNQSPICNFL